MAIFPVEKNGMWAYIDGEGNLLTEFCLRYADSFSENKALVRLKDNKEWAINDTFDLLFEIPWECFSSYSGGMLQFRISDKAGYLNELGEQAIEPKFDSARDFMNGYASVKIRGKWGLIDKQGNTVLLPTFDFIGTAREDGILTCAVSTGNEDSKYGLVNVQSEILVKPKYSASQGYNEGLACMRDANDKYGYLDIGGNWIIKPKYDDATLFMNGTASAGNNDKWGIINKAGDWVVDPIYAWTRQFHEGLAAVYVGGKWGYEYPQGGKWGFVDGKGQMAIPAIFDDIGDFKNGICSVSIGDVAGDIDGISSKGYIDKSGKYIWEPSR